MASASARDFVSYHTKLSAFNSAKARCNLLQEYQALIPQTIRLKSTQLKLGEAS